MPIPPQDLVTRFWRFVAVCVHGRACRECCHEWQGFRHRNNYGTLTLCPSVRHAYGIYTHFAHRIAWQLSYGPIDRTQHICHTCDNPPCVNVAHLWRGDARENQHDSMRKGRKPIGDLHPMRLHPERRATGDRNGSRKYIERMPRGEESATAKLTADAVRIIRHRAAAGMTQQAMADEYHVSQSLISLIVLRKTWKHID